VAEGFLTAGPPALIGFNPNKAQKPFMVSDAQERWMICGNRAGKTYMGIADICLDLIGCHQFRPRFSDPWDPDVEFAEREKRGSMRWWSAAPDFPNIWDVTHRKYFMEFLRPLGAVWRSAERRIIWKHTCQGPSGRVYEWDCEIFAKSYDSGEEKFQSAGVAGIQFDEEPPYPVYDEATTRFDREWDLWITGTMTPVNGMTWVYDKIYLPFESGTGEETRVVFGGSMLDNLENLPRKLVERRLRMYPEGTDEYAIRIRGEFVRRSGLIYGGFSRDIHVIDDFDPLKEGGYTLYRGIDPGWNNPTACVWAAVNSENEVFIYREYNERDRALRDHANAILGMSGMHEQYRFSVVDPAAKQTDPVSGQSMLDYLTSAGIPCIPGDNDVARGISTVSDYLRVQEVSERPRLFVCRSCRETVREFLSYSWALQTRKQREIKNPHDKPQKKDDHIMDALRYLLMSGPRYWEQPMIRREEETHAEWGDTGYA
jgi:phage terminase large subunit-like protein